MRMHAVLISLLFVSSALLSHGARAQESDFDFLIGQKPKPFIDPAGFYAVVLPTGFDCQAKARHVECKGNRGVDALLTIDVQDVPASATNEIVLLNQQDRFKQKPHFKMIGKGKRVVDKSPAVTAAYSYDYLGNVEYSVGVQALYMVRGNKVYVVHLESRLDQFPTYKKDLEQLYASFHPARLDAGGNPILEDLKPQPVQKGNTGSDVDRALSSGW